MSLRHHVVQVASVLEQFPDLDALLLLIGANDFLRYVGGRTEALNWREDPRSRIRVHYVAFDIPRRPSFGPLYERTEWIRHLRLAKRRLRRRLQPAEYLEIANDGRSYTTWRHVRATATELIDTLPSLMPALDAFAADLKIIADLAERRGVELVILTQPTMWAPDLPPELQSLLWMGEIGNARGNGYGMYYTASALAEGMAQFNLVTKRICEERSIRCIDLARSLPKDTSVFYDDMHFNEPGAQQVADLVAPVLAPLLTVQVRR